MSRASILMRRMPAARSSLLRRGRPRQGGLHFHPSAAASAGRGPIIGASSSLSSSSWRWRSTTTTTRRREVDATRSVSSAARDDEDEDDDDVGTRRRRPLPPAGGGSAPPSSSSRPLLPTRHSRSLPPPACPPSLLRREVESIFDAPLGSLIAYGKPAASGILRSVEEEIADAYYASDAAVQRAEYVMRGLNAGVSGGSYVSRCIARGTMTYEGEEDDWVEAVGGRRSRGTGGKKKEEEGGGGPPLGKEECFRAMLDLLERMSREGETYVELRTRVRSQVLDPSVAAAAASDDAGDAGGSSSSDTDSDSSSDSDDEGGGSDERDADESFERWAESVNKNMGKVGITNNTTAAGPGGGEAKGRPSDVGGGGDEDGDAATIPTGDPEKYQFGADPGVTTHMHDLVLDALACLCHEHYRAGKDAALVDLVYLMPEDSGSPPELAKSMLDAVLHRHWMDGGDVGGAGGGLGSPMGGIGRGIGVGAGTGAGSLGADASPYGNFDVRTCPTPMSFNAVLRVAANFDPMAYAEAAENARVLGGSVGNSTKESVGIAADVARRERERLRDVAIDAALSTYSRMYECSALTLRTLRNSTKMATSRSALRRQARLLDGNVKGKRANDVVCGRNSATYAYLIRTIGNCIPPSLSRGNMAFALYHKGCVEEGVMDEEVVKAMMSLGGYDVGIGNSEVDDGSDAPPPAPPISNGPLFDSFMQKELGLGVKVAVDKGRKLRQDRNYKMRRHVEWDGTY